VFTNESAFQFTGVISQMLQMWSKCSERPNRKENG